MDKTRIGLVGYGTMGVVHAEYLLSGEVAGAELTAVCDLSEANLTRAKDALGDAEPLLEPRCFALARPAARGRRARDL